MQSDSDLSLSDEATSAGRPRPKRSDISFGDERTVGAGLSGSDTIIDGIEVVDLETRYRIEGTLGQGGMGAVLLATDTRLGRKVAIKRILGEAAGNRMAVQRFLTEATSIAALNHPNIVTIHDYGRAKDGPFLSMEYVDGGSLLDRCSKSGLPLEEVIDLACQLCDGLAKAHDLGIIHRDIKPSNILLTIDGIPKLADFGLAKASHGDRQATVTGKPMGTPDFMPPEQRQDAKLVDHRSDLWSLAATVYQMATGRSPKIIRFDLLPPELTKVLGKALEDEKESRYQSARDFRDALRTAREGSRKSTAPAKFDGVLQEGQCKACGTVTSDLTKKFCRSPQCGASLRVACLKCDAQMPVWDGVCGECGGNQPALLEARQAALAATQAQAESLANACLFAAAITCAGELSVQTHPDLAEFAAWAGPFVAATTAEKTRQEAASAERLHEAKTHAAAWDYTSAIHVLESVPPPLRDQEARYLFEACVQRKRESDSLVATIADRIKHKDLDGLLPLVSRAVALRGDRKDLAKISGQLIERCETRLKHVIAALQAGDANAAVAALAGAVKEDFTAEQRRLIERVREASDLECRIVSLVKESRADATVTPEKAIRILEVADKYLALNPKNDQMARLAAQCRRIATPWLRSQEIIRRTIAGAATAAETIALEPIRNSVDISLKLLPAGKFCMGNWGDHPDEVSHWVTLTKPFYIGVYPVTNAQWKVVMGSVPSKWKDTDRPVERVTWEEATEFCRKLSALPEEKQAGRVYRLPTEAEWEYACRAHLLFMGGWPTRWSFGDAEQRLGHYAWFNENSGGQTHPVGKKIPNAWGLYDMHGNVWEWCSDWYGDYPKGDVEDPQGPSGGSFRVHRGGGWNGTAWHCRSASRFRGDPSSCCGNLGLRLVLSLS